ncbi:hypothetical protein EYZ11_010720 [Aspergillus tanneri]|uniref:Uncharacterized protein n=1 Tax=Aspergillus tanneri TaxID=1220188 RepID=A0A4S3J4X9_9EURO|nr:hypothetical protein EYZ11_010720 [Aspergillus tanneri]
MSVDPPRGVLVPSALCGPEVHPLRRLARKLNI